MTRIGTDEFLHDPRFIRVIRGLSFFFRERVHNRLVGSRRTVCPSGLATTVSGRLGCVSQPFFPVQRLFCLFGAKKGQRNGTQLLFHAQFNELRPPLPPPDFPIPDQGQSGNLFTRGSSLPTPLDFLWTKPA